MKNITKKEQELRAQLSVFNLNDQQFNGIIKEYGIHKKSKISLEQAKRFKDMNAGTKCRDCVFMYNTQQVKNWGVYRIDYGEGKFYIGRSKDVFARIKLHKKEIIKFFVTGEYCKDHYLTKVFEYLKENIMAYAFNVELLEKCYTVDELQQVEQKYLTKYQNVPNCLNYSFIAKKPQNEIDETPSEYLERKADKGVAIRGGNLVFFRKSDTQTDRRVESVTKSTPAKKQMANEFSFNVPEIESTLGHTVFRLYYGDRYIIHKGKTLAGSIFLLQKGCGYFLAYKHDKLSKFELDYYHTFYNFIKNNPGKQFRVEVVLTSNDPYEILITEQQELNKHMKYKKMLNNNLQGYIPTLNPKTGMHGWITKEQVERFYSFVASL